MTLVTKQVCDAAILYEALVKFSGLTKMFGEIFNETYLAAMFNDEAMDHAKALSTIRVLA